MSRPVCPRCGNSISYTRLVKALTFSRVMTKGGNEIKITPECACGYESEHRYTHEKEE